MLGVEPTWQSGHSPISGPCDHSYPIGQDALLVYPAAAHPRREPIMGMKQAPADPGGCLEHGGECLVGFLWNWALEKELTSLITAGLSELDDDLPATPPDRQGQQQRMRASQSESESEQSG